MSPYADLSVNEAYRLVNHGPVILVSTRCADGRYNIAPIAWTCPVQKGPTRILITIDTESCTYRNIQDRKEFIICVPNIFQADLVRKTGSVSGFEVDKFKEFGLKGRTGKKVDAQILTEGVGYMECRLIENFVLNDVGLIIGETVSAGADSEGLKGRVLPEKEEGKTLHHLGGGIFGILEGVNEK